MKQNEKKDWFRIKRYPHISLPLEPYHKNWVEKYVTKKENISKHPFSPFIHRKIQTRKFRKEIAHDGTRSKLRKPDVKERELYYANHLDANVFSYYSKLLSECYENKLKEAGIENCVTAYRRIKLNPSHEKSRNKCNIDFANEIFTFIKNSEEDDLVAITFDIKSFFDNLNHKKLKKAWRETVDDFGDDHYNVFRNITKFSYIEEDNLFEFFKNDICIERHPNLIKRKALKKKQHLRNQRAVAFCEKSEIENIRVNGLIKANKYEYDKLTKSRLGLRVKGIPQGSPISSVLANIYLLGFDKAANDLISHLHGIYRRYSDDMVVVCKVQYAQTVIDFFHEKIKDYDLEIQVSKTQVFEFKQIKSEKRFVCFQKNLKTNRLQRNTNFEYLGFQFDGKYVLLKASSLANYYRKMKRSFARGSFYMRHNNTETKNKLFKGRLYKRFTHLGSSRRRIYQRDKTDKSKFVLSKKYDWGNYLTYAKLASKTFNENKIMSQVRKHWLKFHQAMDEIE